MKHSKTKNKLSHITGKGAITMVDVSAKPPVKRRALAQAILKCKKSTIDLLKRDALPKGDAITAAQIAGIQAAKQTSTLIPLCHPLPIQQISVRFEVGSDEIMILSEVVTTGNTGVEMEALTAVAVAGLTLYDMLKAVDKEMILGEIIVVKKVKGTA